ncbi:ABC transporter ATPase [uncultured Dysosmobacter sp.]|uniref:ABC transporter ATPase n=1 Tax=uncultured Dysosmobacter sp. TaxID=2591384 RepID=UPI002613EF1C|nr:ABC transporter ATPase [uncultured Dysosmobacter sp.]
MERLSTIQKRHKLNAIWAVGITGPGGAYHTYDVYRQDNGARLVQIQFQKGPRNDPAAVSGVLDTDLLEIVRDRMKAFQDGEFATRENALALTHIEEALLWLNKRTEDRAERNVLGTYEK